MQYIRNISEKAVEIKPHGDGVVVAVRANLLRYSSAFEPHHLQVGMLEDVVVVLPCRSRDIDNRVGSHDLMDKFTGQTKSARARERLYHFKLVRSKERQKEMKTFNYANVCTSRERYLN
jgi:hypothetical protein